MSWFSRLRYVFRKDELYRELDEELHFHVEQRAADEGVPIAEARRRLGNALRLREESRDVKLATWLESLLQDARFALRVWRKRPIVALTAILTIALGAGMNVAVFQVIWSVMLKPLPYADANRLVQVWLDDGKEERNAPENTLIKHWREASRAFTHIASYRPWRVTVASGGDPEQVFTALISPEFFATLGAPLLAGRGFTQEEMKAGTDNVILLVKGIGDDASPRTTQSPAPKSLSTAYSAGLLGSCRTPSSVRRSFRVRTREQTLDEGQIQIQTSICPSRERGSQG